MASCLCATTSVLVLAPLILAHLCTRQTTPTRHSKQPADDGTSQLTTYGLERTSMLRGSPTSPHSSHLCRCRPPSRTGEHCTPTNPFPLHDRRRYQSLVYMYLNNLCYTYVQSPSHLCRNIRIPCSNARTSARDADSKQFKNFKK